MMKGLSQDWSVLLMPSWFALLMSNDATKMCDHANSAELCSAVIEFDAQSPTLMRSV